MPKNREIFEALTKDQLVDIARHLGHRSMFTGGSLIRQPRQAKFSKK